MAERGSGPASHPLGFRPLWAGTMMTVRRHHELLWPLAGAFFFLPQLVLSFLVPAGGVQHLQDLARAPILLAGLGLSLVATVMGQLVAAYVAYHDGTRGFTYGAVIARAGGLLLAGLAVALLQAAATAAGAMLFILPGLYLYTRFSMALPILAAEGGDPLRALRRSWEATSGQVVRIFVNLVLLVAIFLLCYATIISVGLMANGPGSLEAGGLAGGWGIGRWVFELMNATAVAIIGIVSICFYARMLLVLQQLQRMRG